MREIGSFLVFLAGVVFLFWGFRSVWRTLVIKRSGGKATGAITRRRVDREDTLITILFSTNQNQHIRFEQLRPPFCKPNPAVFYDYRNPQRATVSPRLDILYGLIAMAFGGYFVAETLTVVQSIFTT